MLVLKVHTRQNVQYMNLDSSICAIKSLYTLHTHLSITLTKLDLIPQ